MWGLLWSSTSVCTHLHTYTVLLRTGPRFCAWPDAELIKLQNRLRNSSPSIPGVLTKFSENFLLVPRWDNYWHHCPGSHCFDFVNLFIFFLTDMLLLLFAGKGCPSSRTELWTQPKDRISVWNCLQNLLWEKWRRHWSVHQWLCS